MKTNIYKLLITLILAICASNLWAQSEIPATFPVASQNTTSLRYGGDIIINDQPGQDQRLSSLAIAYNGWLFAAYAVNSASPCYWTVFMSTNDGASWTPIINQILAGNYHVQAIDIMVCGTSIADLDIFVARINENDATPQSSLILTAYNANTGTVVRTLHSESISADQKFLDVAIASDYYYPAISAGLYSDGMVYSKTTASMNYVNFISYADEGATPQTEKTVYSGGMFTRNVAVAYGRSATYNNGRYYVAWEERTYSTNDIGQIWTAHTVSLYNDDFTAPLRLDNMVAASAGYCRNPSISCQFNNTDNTMGNYTEVVLFDRAYNGNTSDFDIIGTYNREASNTDNWFIFGMYATTASNDYQSDINFDPAYNNFLATYYNSTETKLRYLVENMDLPDPYNWIIIQDRYNDAGNLVNPYPKVEINPVYNMVAHIWNAERSGGNGEIMYDAEYFAVGIQSKSDEAAGVKVYPNPASSNVQFELSLPFADHFTVKLSDMYGKTGNVLFEGNLPKGESVISADVSGLAAGCYFYTVQSAKLKSTGRLVICR
jgi:hypothetical protein